VRYVFAVSPTGFRFVFTSNDNRIFRFVRLVYFVIKSVLRFEFTRHRVQYFLCPSTVITAQFIIIDVDSSTIVSRSFRKLRRVRYADQTVTLYIYIYCIIILFSCLHTIIVVAHGYCRYIYL